MPKARCPHHTQLQDKQWRIVSANPFSAVCMFANTAFKITGTWDTAALPKDTSTGGYQARFIPLIIIIIIIKIKATFKMKRWQMPISNPKIFPWFLPSHIIPCTVSPHDTIPYTPACVETDGIWSWSVKPWAGLVLEWAWLVISSSVFRLVRAAPVLFVAFSSATAFTLSGPGFSKATHSLRAGAILLASCHVITFYVVHYYFLLLNIYVRQVSLPASVCTCRA